MIVKVLFKYLSIIVLIGGYTMAHASDLFSDTQFSVNQVLNNTYSLDICIPKNKDTTPSVLLVHWENGENVFQVPIKQLEFKGPWYFLSVLYTPHVEKKDISVDVDFHSIDGTYLKTEEYSLGKVISEFKSKGIIQDRNLNHKACEGATSHASGEIYKREYVKI